MRSPLPCFAKEFDPLLIVLWESGGEERTAGGEGYRDSLAQVSFNLLGLGAGPSESKQSD